MKSMIRFTVALIALCVMSPTHFARGDDPIPPALPVPMPAAPGIEESALSTQKQAQLRQLEQQIDELVHRIQSPQRSPQIPLPSKPEWQPSAGSAVAPVVPPPVEPATPESIDQFLNQPAPTAPAVLESKSGTESVPIPDTIAGEIDRMSLANSLFATQQYAECLRILEHVDEATLGPDDLIWKSYVTACCHRGTGNFKEATRLYREIVARPNADWTRDLAKWWLDHLQEKSQLLDRGQQLQATIKRAEEATSAFTSRK